MSLPLQLALVPYRVTVEAGDLNRVAAALSKQVNRDFRPIWGVSATVDAFSDLNDVPSDYWPIVVVPEVEGAAGYHEDRNGQPFALVAFGDDWSLTASHECLEMLADPWGREFRAGMSPEQAVDLGYARRRVNYLVEVCDPSESGHFAYTVNGVWVSDFYTPHFFDPVPAIGVRYSYTGAIAAPRTVLDGGYISWLDFTTNEMWQLRMFPDQDSSDVPHLVNLSKNDAFVEATRCGNLRAVVDRHTHTPNAQDGLAGREDAGARDEDVPATRAPALAEAIDALLGAEGTGSTDAKSRPPAAE